MKLTPPTKRVFWIATVVAILGLLEYIIDLPVVGGHEFWLTFVAFALLWLGNTMKGF